ncbi:hypothetical protein P256_00030 [Acinetobacter nectaris CIP 110549]|uniref:ERF superfamily protein n=1 Tax=Acinetobacter nectaris CIP 110549 TaxID=1392540 RepID=V2TZ17_9GAMM|nr:ERF family protein [Acinetobacter nectaris]ESK41045.1 hypothetical protein P256_00030 [Acinetobacter nectaris CIP 110549]
MNAPVEIQKPIASQENQLFGLVEKVLSSANPDMAVIEKMLDMQERVLAKQAEMAFNRDFAMMSNEIPVIAKSSESKIQTKSGSEFSVKYASLGSIIEIVRPILATYGFSVSFQHKQENASQIKIFCILRHRDGHSAHNELILPLDNSGAKSSVQQVGSTITYGKRYSICSLLNIATGDDNDGFTANAKTIRPKIKPARFNNALDAIRSKEITKDDLLSEYTLTDEQKAQVEAL